MVKAPELKDIIYVDKTRSNLHELSYAVAQVYYKNKETETSKWSEERNAMQWILADLPISDRRYID